MGGLSYYGEDDLEPDVLSQMATVRQQQASALAQHQQAAEDLQRQQQEANTKDQDLQLADRMIKVMDPRVPKSARDFLFRELSGTLGVDPAGARSKDIGKMLTSMQPDELETLQMAFVEKMATAKPGELTQMMKGILQGQIDGHSFISGIMKTSAVQAAAAAGEPGGEEEEGGGARPQPAQMTQSEVLRTVEGEYGDRRRLPTPGEVEPRFQPADPGLVQALGLDPRVRYRNDDLINDGYNIPIDAKAQRDLAKEIKDSAAGGHNVSMAAARVHALFNGKPEVLGVVGTAARGIDQVIDQIKGAARSAGLDNESEGPSDKGLKAIAQNIVERMGKAYQASGIPQTAIDSARLQGAIVDMAYELARARGIPGNRLTNAIIAQHLNTLGHSQSVAQFEATLRDTVQRTTEITPNLIASRIGRRDTHADLSFVADDDLKVLGKSTITPINVKERVLHEMKRRSSGDEDRGKELPRSTPTLEGEDAGRAREEKLRQERLRFREEREKGEFRLKEKADKRADSAEKLAAERFQYAKNKDARDRAERLRLEKKKDDLKRAELIGEAFSELGKAISKAGESRSIGGGFGSGGGGGGQDQGAFRIAPPPQRRPPPIPDLVKKK